MSSALESWDSGAFRSGRRKARKKSRTRKDRYDPAPVCGRGRDRSEGFHPWAWGSPRKEANAAFPVKSESRTHRVAGQKLNCNPACATSQRLPQPGYRRGTGLAENKAGWGRRNCELPRPEGRPRGGQTRPPPPSEREAGRAGRGCLDAAPPARPRCRASLRPFHGGQLPAAAAQPPNAPAPAARGYAWPALGRLPGCRQPDRPSPPGVETNFLRPGPPAAQAARRLPLQASRGSGCRRPRPAMRAFLPAPLQPRAPGERLAVPAPPLQQSRRPGGEPPRG